ncbi:MAG: NADH-quinone oxidoreductase subunit C, partial [Micromonosporaceae bacterium]
MTGDVEFVEAAPAEYRTQIARAEAGGYRFGGLYASDAGAVVRTILAAPDSQLRLISTRTDDGATSSIVDIFPAAGWDEREAADLYRVGFAGHEPLRPLVRRSDVGAWTVPVTGSGPYQVAVGPIHAGIIESGHFRFHVVGDRILHLDAQLFYKHRGLERAAEGHDLAASQRYLGRACAACSVANTVAYAHACEDVLGLAESAELSRVRTLLLELERTWSHLNDIAAICAGVGLAAGNHRFLALTERARRLNAALTGHRFLFDTVRIGGSDLVIDADQVAAARAELAELRHEARVSWRELIFNASLQDRLSGVGVLTAENAHRLGTVGPAARAAGLAEDAR